MASSLNILRQELCKIHPISVLRRQFNGSVVVFNNQPGQSETIQATPAPEPVVSAPSINENVPGLSTAVHTNEEPVGPGAAKNAEYKVPEYFNFNKMSYFEAEIELHQFRLPQPSALKN